MLDEILEEARELTTGQLRARSAKLVMAVDPVGAASSFAERLAERHIEKLARRLKVHGETRTLEQLRNDVALDLLIGKCVHGRTTGGRANITISAETLLGLSTEPGDIDGFGPVIAEIAKETVFENIDGEWTFTVTDNGRPVATGTLSRRPTGSQQRQIRSEYPRCVMVGCRQPAYDCDIDHRRAHAQGGATHNDNLGPLCRHHHMARHHGYWELKRLPSGDHQWTSPLGHQYTRKRGHPGQT